MVFALVDSAGTPIKLRFVRSRRADLPQMEEDGAVKELAIPKHAGVADSTHLVFFAKGLVGADWNYHGPRATALAHYINVKTEPASLISIRPLLRADLASALDRLQSVRVLDLKIRSSYIPTVRDVSGTLADAFESAREVGGAQESRYSAASVRKGARLSSRRRNHAGYPWLAFARVARRSYEVPNNRTKPRKRSLGDVRPPQGAPGVP